jgi:glycosyltransferase involved in cell wall biosynthesis
MKQSQKQQVVFIARKLWSGGAEKVLYYLANRLDPEKFEPIVIYMLWQDDIPVKYDPSIPLYCLQKGDMNLNESKNEYLNMSDPAKEKLEPAVDTKEDKPKQNFLRMVIQILYRAYHSLPEPVKQHIALRQRILNLAQISQPSKLDDNKTNEESDKNPQLGISARNDAERIAISIGINIPDVIVMNKILQSVRKDAILIPMQEEPTVRVWISQIYGAFKYISYLCAPESLQMPLIYPEKNRYKIENWLFANSERNANAVVVPNQWMRDDMVNQFGTNMERTHIIENPVDCELVINKMNQPCTVDLAEIGDKTLFVQLARVDTQKNHVLLVEACKLLREKYEDFIVLVIGNGNEFEKINKLIKDYGLENHIRLLGESANPYPILSRARASLLTSKWEASPLVLVDSMLCGAVPISVDCIAGPRDMLGDNQFGILVPPENPHLFAEAMYRIANDNELHARLREQGLQEAWKYDIKKVVKEWEDLILKVASNQVEDYSINGKP